MKIHHLGYLVKDLKKTTALLSRMGFYQKSKLILDSNRGIQLQFMKKDECLIEVVMPVSKDSRYASILAMRRNMIYHICYESSKLDSDILELQSLGYQLIGEGEEAVGLDFRKAYFFYHPHMGLIEIVPSWSHKYRDIIKELEDVGCVFYDKLFKQINEEEWEPFLHTLSEKTGKKLALLFGNCHVTVLSRLLMASPAFRREYFLFVLPPVFDMQMLGIGYIPSNLLKGVDLFLYQSISKNNIYGEQWASESLLQSVSPECVRISFPNTVFYGYFPQETTRHDTIIKNQINHVPMFCGDKYIDIMYAQTGSIKMTIEKLLDEQAITAEDINKNLKKSIRMLELQDMGCTIQMRDYVENNFRRIYLFTEPKHPCDRFFKEMTIRILRYLNLEEELDEDATDEQYTLSTINRLIYPAVSKQLELEFSVDRYFVDRRLSEQRFSFEEFIEVYIRNTAEME